ncbi:MAG TPA: type 1 glutamine amidotransferase [Verrucomicrobiae bacterium]|nr:type 1 glutamine amidotransferase [Verrucomicrobiae bacterium]
MGSIAPWLAVRGFRTTRTRLFDGDDLPASTDFDWLVVMGGPMNIYQHDRYPWLIHEKALIRDACVKNKRVLGICLGAQLLADVLGGRVNRNAHEEIGFFDLQLTEEGSKSHILSGMTSPVPAFHWHEDTYALPPGCVSLLKSDACVNQAFTDGSLRLGLQFHWEVTHADAMRWLDSDAPAPGGFVQSRDEMLRLPERYAGNNRLMSRLLDNFIAA